MTDKEVVAVNLGRTATKLQELVAKDKKLQKSFSGLGPMKYKKLGEFIKRISATKSMFTQDAMHFMLRFMLFETDMLGKSSGTYYAEGLDSKQLGVLLSDDLLAVAHPKIRVAKKMGLLSEKEHTDKQLNDKARIGILVLGKNGSLLYKFLKGMGVEMPKYKNFQRIKFWKEKKML